MPLCFACKKNQPIVLYERKTLDGVRVEPYCLACYEKLFLTIKPEDENEKSADVCPYCKRTAEDLQKTALVGCAHCYHALRSVMPTVVRMQQGQKDAHRGKVAENLKPKAKAERRRQEMLALQEYYSQAGKAELAERYAENADALELEIKRGNYDGY